MLSMSPVSASRVRFAIRAVSSQNLREIAAVALASDSPARVSALLDETLGEPLRDILGGQATALDLA
jgi:hypothetical protein